MAHVIVMPKLGLTMTEGTVGRWLKVEGDPVQQGEEICEIETDKISHMMEAPAAGYLRLILVREGDTANVQIPIAVIAEMEEDLSEWAQENQTDQQVKAGNPESTESKNSSDRINEQASYNEMYSDRPMDTDEIRLATPAAKAFARKQGIHLHEVSGTGPGNRIQERDVIAFHDTEKKRMAATPAAAKFANEHQINLANIPHAEGRIRLEDVAAMDRQTKQETSQERKKKVIPLRGVRKVTAAKMQESWNTIPHVTLHRKLNITKLTLFNQLHVKEADYFQGVHITLTHQLVKACAIILQSYDFFNASLENEQITVHEQINIGVAAATEQGLLVPVITCANEKKLPEISREAKELVEAARNQRLNPDHLTGGTFTISNLGMFDIEYFTPIINPPQSAILGVGKIEQTEEEAWLYASLSFDHRIIDGAEAARFLNELQRVLDQPLSLFI